MYKPPRGLWSLRDGVLVAATIALLVFFYTVGPSLRLAPHPIPRDRWGDDGETVKEQAVRFMREGIEIIAQARIERGFAIDGQADPNRTGLIGFEYSETTTTLGDLPAKRTGTNPAWAGVIAEWMVQVGVGPGDVVWATFSGSFPGLNLATLAAAEAVGAELVAISSLGASTWGANIPHFPWSDMEWALRQAGLMSNGSAAFTLGGNRDSGPALLGDGTTPLREAVARTDIPLLEPKDVQEAIDMRLETFTQVSGTNRPALFVNVGGGHAVLGDCPESASLPSGLLRGSLQCTGRVPGLLYIMNRQNVPVIHLLNVKQLALTVGIPLDARF